MFLVVEKSFSPGDSSNRFHSLPELFYPCDLHALPLQFTNQKFDLSVRIFNDSCETSSYY